MSADEAPALLGIDHVQISIPRGAEETCRTFYCGVLGMREIPKPPVLAARGGIWVRGGPVEIHLGVEEDFRPARKAHPALAVSDLDSLAKRLAAAGHEPIWDNAFPGLRRFFASDPTGNRIEFMESRRNA
jgi:catechol 2,3-dioxygenase-like lactoylglutathione lyase family enzyme